MRYTIDEIKEKLDVGFGMTSRLVDRGLTEISGKAGVFQFCHLLYSSPTGIELFFLRVHLQRNKIEIQYCSLFRGQQISDFIIMV